MTTIALHLGTNPTRVREENPAGSTAFVGVGTVAAVLAVVFVAAAIGHGAMLALPAAIFALASGAAAVLSTDPERLHTVTEAEFDLR